MFHIIPSTVSSKKRVLSTFAHEKTDRVPINYLSNPSIHKKLANKLGVRSDTGAVQQALGVDFKELMPKYIGPPLFQPKTGKKVNPLWGHVTKWVDNDFGGYWDYCDFPFSNASEDIIAQWPLPSADDFDYEDLLASCKQYKDYAIHLGHPGLCDIMNSTGMLRRMENIYMDLLLETPAIIDYIDRRTQVQVNIIERALHKCSDYIDFIWTGEDLGTQHTPLISLDLFRKQIRPRHQLMVDLAHHYNKYVMIHCCGSSSWAFNDFIAMGIHAVDTLQPEATNMSPEYLSTNFGDKLTFHGCISTASLATMTVDEVTQNVQSVLNTMKKHKGYCLAPTHLIQDNTPVENILAMYQTGHKLGTY